MTPYEYLQDHHHEELPPWLGRFNHGDPFPREEFFASRVVYYPGSGTDGHPVKLCGSTHSCHCFVYADYQLTQADLEAELGHPRHGFRGYHTFSRIQLDESDLVPNGWSCHVQDMKVLWDNDRVAAVATSPFGFLEVLERDHGLEDAHGAGRLAILFLGADGIATYDALFCQRDCDPPPFGLVLQDHGFGGNYDRFGQYGLLERIAIRCNVFPRWLLVAEDTRPWRGFMQVHCVLGDRGGRHNTLRRLHERRDVWPGCQRSGKTRRSEGRGSDRCSTCQRASCLFDEEQNEQRLEEGLSASARFNLRMGPLNSYVYGTGRCSAGDCARATEQGAPRAVFDADAGSRNAVATGVGLC